MGKVRLVTAFMPQREDYVGPHLIECLVDVNGLAPCKTCRVTVLLNHSGQATAHLAPAAR